MDETRKDRVKWHQTAVGNAEVLLEYSEEILISDSHNNNIGLEINIDKTKYIITNRERLNINGHLTDKEDFEKVSQH